MPELGPVDWVRDENGGFWEDRYKVCWVPIKRSFRDVISCDLRTIEKMVNSPEAKEATKRLESIMDRGNIFGHYFIFPDKKLLRLGCSSKKHCWFEYLEFPIDIT